MTSVKQFLAETLLAMSDHGSVLISKAVHYFGLASVGGGVVIGLATDTVDRIMLPSVWHLSDWAAVVSIVGGLSFLIKNLVDLYFSIKNKGRK